MQHPEGSMQITINLQHALAELCLIENGDQLLIKYPSSTEDSGLPRDCGLSFREIGSRVGRNQTTAMRKRKRYRWIQESTTDQRGRSHRPQCTTSRERGKLCAWQ
ncbi:hypothetical protein TNCV_2353331 [Trichonephila clavipes]|nr:hypothetical protein TNCV_2353331 [Trichonephila clavipes]